MLSQSLAPARLPTGQRVYAIGDIHGCLDQLTELHALIRADLVARPVAVPTLVYLGDFVDRGPDSAGVVDLLLQPWPEEPAPAIVTLLGNHEDMMLTVLATADSSAAGQWLANGGGESLASWHVPLAARPSQWWSAVPPTHLDFLRGLSLMHRAGGYIFVHAGLRPDLPLERQRRHDLIWIREPFLSWDGPLPGVVVHGHTPAPEPTVRSNRIGIDTGAVLGGKLTCVVLEEETLAFFQV